MKYKWRRYWLSITAFVVLIIILSLLNGTNTISTQVFFGLTLTCVASFVSIMGHHQNSDKFFKELFTEFNKRYDKLNNFLNSIRDDQKLTCEERQKIIDYLNLCAEEYMWVQKGWIPAHIWESWKNGIKIHQRKPAIKQVFDTEKEIWKSSYYGFFDELD